MRFLTLDEFQHTKVYALDDVTYKRIETAFIQTLGEVIGKRILTKYAEKTVQQLSTQSWIDIMSLINIL